MPETENKVQFGLEKVHYAVLEGGAYGTPVPIPGAVNLSLNPVGEMEKFYADNVVYYVSNTNDGYDGDLEVADKISMQMLSTDLNVPPEKLVLKKSEKQGWFQALDVASSWLDRMDRNKT